MKVLTATATVCLLLFAGCADTGPADLQSRSDALLVDAADELGEDARLYAILGIEPHEDLPAEDAEGCGPVKKDRRPGDGQAPIWGYHYGSETTGRSLVVFTDAAGKILCEHDEGGFPVGMRPLTHWKLGAPDAARIIAAEVDGYLDMVAGSPVIMQLVNTPEGPVWAFLAILPEPLVLAVHADTGEMLDPEGLVEDDLAPEGGQAQGSSTGTRLAMTTTPAMFSVSQEHARLELVVVSDEPAAELGASYNVRVTGPDGRVEHLSLTNGEMHRIDGPDTGTYEVMVFPAVAGAVEFTVDHCAYTQEHCDGGTPEAMEPAALLRLLPL